MQGRPHERSRTCRHNRAQNERIGEVRVGERHRKDLGDIAGLAASIAETCTWPPDANGMVPRLRAFIS
jgi:hypothetical protein